MDIDDFNRRLIFQVFTQFGNVNIHASCIKIIVINPNGFQSEVPLQNIVGIVTQQAQQLRFLGGQFHGVAIANQGLLAVIEGVFSQFIGRRFGTFTVACAA